jgi:hypothetical protein
MPAPAASPSVASHPPSVAPHPPSVASHPPSVAPHPAGGRAPPPLLYHWRPLLAAITARRVLAVRAPHSLAGGLLLNRATLAALLSACP